VEGGARPVAVDRYPSGGRARWVPNLVEQLRSAHPAVILPVMPPLWCDDLRRKRP